MSFCLYLLYELLLRFHKRLTRVTILFVVDIYFLWGQFGNSGKLSTIPLLGPNIYDSKLDWNYMHASTFFLVGNIRETWYYPYIILWFPHYNFFRFILYFIFWDHHESDTLALFFWTYKYMIWSDLNKFNRIWFE